MLKLEAAGLQQQKTIMSSTPVSQEQESVTTMRAGSPKLEHSDVVLDNLLNVVELCLDGMMVSHWVGY